MSLNLDPSVGLAKIILGLALFVGIFQLVIHGIKGIKWIQKMIFQNEGVTQEVRVSLNSPALEALTAKSDSMFKLCASYLSYLIPVFRYILATMYCFSILVAVLDSYFIFTDKKFAFDNYLARFGHSLAMQFFIICLAWLLWGFATQGIRRFIPWGLFIISLDVVIEIVLQFFNYPFFHWLRATELLRSGLTLLIIPTTGFLVFNYLYKSRRE